MTLKMSELKTGQRGTVTEMLNGGEMRRRLLDLGFMHGSTVICAAISPLGDPTAFYIKGTVVAIRKKDASNILVTVVEGAKK